MREFPAGVNAAVRIWQSRRTDAKLTAAPAMRAVGIVSGGIAAPVLLLSGSR